MKKNDLPSKIKQLSLMVVLLVIMMFSCLAYHKHNVYNRIEVDVIDNASIEYGSANYSINDLVKKVDGDVVSVKNDIDTSTVGEQEVLLRVKKDNVIRDIPLKVAVVDTVAPTITLKEEKITITKGDDLDLTSNIDSVNDQVDGVISYLNEVNENSNNYYDFTYDESQINEVGTHEVTVNAKDKNGNVTNIKFSVEVVEPQPVVVYNQPVYANVPANPQGNDVVSIAYSLIGSPYIAGSNGPYGFDCSGFVQYVYSRVGKYVSRSSSTQYYEGVGVNYASAQPGDILSWGYVDGQPTHSALYVGGGMMIHATNPSQGVLLSDVAAWTRGSGTHVIAVRRVQ